MRINCSRRQLFGLAALTLFASMLNGPSLSGAEVLVGASIKSSQRVSMDKIDHAIWDGLLRKYVDEDGMVNYRDWQASRRDIQILEQYLRRLSSASLTAKRSRTAEVAYWINAYNAVTVKGIFREYPTTSIRNHTAKLFGYNIWKNLKLQVDGKRYSLEHIEHEILRKKNEPRIHFAIVCASKGCPRLLNEAYTSDDLDEQLDRNAKDFFARSANFRMNQRAKTLYMSAILDWFGEDFGSSQTSQLRAISKWLPTDAAKQLATNGSAKVSYLDYDWSLNEQKTRTAKR